MFRALAQTMILVAVFTSVTAAQNRPRFDEYSKATGFSVDIEPGKPDEGWEHITDALVTISHESASAAAKPMSIPETLMKFTMRDAYDNRADIELSPCRDYSAAICLYLTTIDLPKSSESWLKTLLGKKIEHRDLLVTITKSNGEKRTFNLVDTFPQSFSYVDIAAEGNAGATIRWTLEVRVDRIEMK